MSFAGLRQIGEFAGVKTGTSASSTSGAVGGKTGSVTTGGVRPTGTTGTTGTRPTGSTGAPSGSGSALDIFTSIASALSPAIRDAAASWARGSVGHDPMKDYFTAVARDAGTTYGASNEDTLQQLVAAGWIPIYCNDSQSARDNIIREFGSRGWTGTPWSKSYDAGFSRKAWYYGATFKLSDAPASVLSAAAAIACGDTAAHMQNVVKFLTDARATVSSAPWNTLLAYAIPATPELCSAMSSGASGSDIFSTTNVFYKTWWFWTLVTLSTAGLITTVALVARRKPQAPTGYLMPSIMMLKKKK